MKKKFIVALATSLVLANGASVAFADHESGHETATTSTTVVGTTSTTVAGTTSTTVAGTTSTTVAGSTSQEKRVVIMATFRASMKDARVAFETARKIATTKDARKAAEVAFKTAVSTATQVKTDALKALGAPSVEPKVTDDQKVAFKAELTKFLEARKAIRTTFHTAVANAKEAFKTARESATTDEARKAARETFLAAGKTARQAFQDALRALGASPAKPVRSGSGK
ncbi:MAG: hypothetical protein ACYC06_11260 [Ilumatobacteraceae bacterium]